VTIFAENEPLEYKTRLFAPSYLPQVCLSRPNTIPATRTRHFHYTTHGHSQDTARSVQVPFCNNPALANKYVDCWGHRGVACAPHILRAGANFVPRPRPDSPRIHLPALRPPSETAPKASKAVFLMAYKVNASRNTPSRRPRIVG